MNALNLHRYEMVITIQREDDIMQENLSSTLVIVAIHWKDILWFPIATGMADGLHDPGPSVFLVSTRAKNRKTGFE